MQLIRKVNRSQSESQQNPRQVCRCLYVTRPWFKIEMKVFPREKQFGGFFINEQRSYRRNECQQWKFTPLGLFAQQFLEKLVDKTWKVLFEVIFQSLTSRLMQLRICLLNES